MEFMKLADVEVVEAATDTDKVLIEQNGEIKRVPKTEVGGAGGNSLILNLNMDMAEYELLECSANMSFEECLSAVRNFEITNAIANTTGVMDGMEIKAFSSIVLVMDYSAVAGGADTIMLMIMFAGEMLPMMWTADGFSLG